MNRLWVRLTVGFLVVVLVLLAGLSYVIYDAVESSFDQYIGRRNAAMFGRQTIDALQAYYAAQGTWAGAEHLLPMAGRGQGARMGQDMGAGQNPAMARGMQAFITGADGLIAIATNPAWVGEPASAIGAGATTPLHVDGVLVGTLGQITPGDQALTLAEAEFRNGIGRTLALFGLAGSLLALGVGLVLAYTLTRPLQSLSAQLEQMDATQLGQPIEVKGPREIQSLAESFNRLSARLATSEQLRRQMTTDVAHELRTPITVLRGQLEGMVDGVHPLDEVHLAIAYDQTLHLARLVNDLRLLTQAESGALTLAKECARPAALVDAAAARFEPLAEDAELHLTCSVTEDAGTVFVDPGRIQQVFDNLLTNALRHTAPGGEIALAVHRQGNEVRFEVVNTGEVPIEDLAHVFDRFWRGDAARTRDAAGSGLGLAITQRIVLLHNGTIRAESAGGMTRFVFTLPNTNC